MPATKRLPKYNTPKLLVYPLARFTWHKQPCGGWMAIGFASDLEFPPGKWAYEFLVIGHNENRLFHKLGPTHPAGLAFAEEGVIYQSEGITLYVYNS